MSGESELISRSAEPLRSSRARTTASGTTRKRTRAAAARREIFKIAFDDISHLAIAERTKRAGADGVAREIRARHHGSDSDGGGDEIHGEGSVGLAEMKMTVAASGASMEATCGGLRAG